jgi:multiple sugar transport system ATP-binding protein
MARIVLEHITKTFGADVVAVDDVSLEIGDAEFMVLVGPSGCGKSTLLRIVAGLEDVSTGEVYIGDRAVTDTPPRERDIAMVFQNYALYPHMTVEQNLSIGLKLRKTPKSEARARVSEVARVLGLDPLLKRKPAELSGGQRQRVAMGRAMVREPLAFLMDEPLSNLDAKLRVQMRAELARLRDRLQTTTIYVTHDQVEAMTLGDRVAVMRDGRIQQLDTPQALYRRPANLFVAAFIGSPSMNLFEAQLNQRNGNMVAKLGDQFLRLDPQALADPGDLERYDGRTVALGIRPEHLEDAAIETGAPAERRLKATVRNVEALGAELIAHLEIAGRPVMTDEVKEVAADLDSTIAAELEAEAHDARLPLVGRFDVASRARADASIEIVVDTSRIHFFDLDSGAAIGGHPVAGI